MKPFASSTQTYRLISLHHSIMNKRNHKKARTLVNSSKKPLRKEFSMEKVFVLMKKHRIRQERHHRRSRNNNMILENTEFIEELENQM